MLIKGHKYTANFTYWNSISKALENLETDNQVKPHHTFASSKTANTVWERATTGIWCMTTIDPDLLIQGELFSD